MATMASLVLEAQGLQKSFLSGTRRIEVLAGVDLAVRGGESVSIRGESGSGKTTLLNLIAGLERADSGDLRWQGDDVAALGNDALARRRSRYLGMVFQSYFLVPELNAVENVLMAARIARQPLAEARERARHLLERVGLAERLEALPATLSGGERQRVAVARALINRPALVLADEPTGNLDERSSEEVLNLLLEVTRDEGASLLLVTHNRAHAALTNRETLLHGGKLEEQRR
jgi:predicted ABC-type transport system involved in lysophospholipase L1 biosynthesis ATPase subunit